MAPSGTMSVSQKELPEIPAGHPPAFSPHKGATDIRFQLPDLWIVISLRESHIPGIFLSCAPFF